MQKLFVRYNNRNDGTLWTCVDIWLSSRSQHFCLKGDFKQALKKFRRSDPKRCLPFVKTILKLQGSVQEIQDF